MQFWIDRIADSSRKKEKKKKRNPSTVLEYRYAPAPKSMIETPHIVRNLPSSTYIIQMFPSSLSVRRNGGRGVRENYAKASEPRQRKKGKTGEARKTCCY